MDLIERDEVILIRGNHEDLLEAITDTWDEMSYLEKENISNGTAETIINKVDIIPYPRINKKYETKDLKNMIMHYQKYGKNII